MATRRLGSYRFNRVVKNGWGAINLAASVTDQILDLWNDASFTNVRIARPSSLTAICVACSAAIAGGSLTVSVRTDAGVLKKAVTLAAASEQRPTFRFAPGEIPFAQDEYCYVTVSTGSQWTSTTLDVFVEVEFTQHG